MTSNTDGAKHCFCSVFMYKRCIYYVAPLSQVPFYIDPIRCFNKIKDRLFAKVRTIL